MNAASTLTRCCPMPINADGNGPETDPAKVDVTACMDHFWETWPCPYDGSEWNVEAVTGKHTDGRRWQAWHVYLRDEPLFWAPSLDLAEQGIEDYVRTGHGPSLPDAGPTT